MSKTANNKPYRVACLGNVLADVLVKPVDVLPAPGGLLPVEHLEIALGGCASNTAAALSRLGVSAFLWGKIGKDLLGDFAASELRRSGVDISSVERDPKASTSATVVLVDRRGQRSFLHSLGANDHIRRRDLPLSRLDRFRHLHVGGYFLFPALDGGPMASILRDAGKAGLTTSLDTAWDLEGRWMKALRPCLPYLDFFMPSEREVRMLLGHCRVREAARTFLGMGCRTVIIKLGKKGSFLMTDRGGEVRAPALRAVPVDSTGAGDCFCAGFIKGISLGWDLGRCLALANAAGACAVEALGATAGIRSFRQVVKRMNDK